MKIKIVSVTCIVLILLAIGCSPQTTPKTSSDPAAVIPIEPTGIIPETGSTEVVELEPSEPEPVVVEQTVPPVPEATPIPAHFTPPVEPAGKYQKIHDQTSEKYTGQNRAYSGDEFAVGRYERSFLQDMTYLPFIDILTAELNREDDNWVFVRIQVMSNPLDNLEDNPLYGVELDVDINNRGEYLILTSPPSGSDWSTDGVQVWQDLNKDVGASTPVKPDEDGAGDGYEDLIFDRGSGDDPDLAWARISPEGVNFVEIAFKHSLLGGAENEKFIWLPWALSGITDPDMFEFNDHFTFAEAGSPMWEYPDFYPLKDLWGLDNTCRGTSGVATTAVQYGHLPEL
ncbi:MAG: hypothetical protein AB9891_05140 [Anaerolineaceae bacterium]